jgi:hypothetical protein
MSNAEEGPVFPGSQGAASVVSWIDRVLQDLRDGRVNDARALLEGQAWRGPNLDGIPAPIQNQLHDALSQAAAALGHPDGSEGDAETALLIARSRFMPGA